MKQKNKNCDHCGPQVVNFRTWLLSWLIPDDLWGVYIGDLCKIHDNGYKAGGTYKDRLREDKQFQHAVELRISNKLKERGDKRWKRKARLGSLIYYTGVRVAGAKQFNFISKGE